MSEFVIDLDAELSEDGVIDLDAEMASDVIDLDAEMASDVIDLDAEGVDDKGMLSRAFDWWAGKAPELSKDLSEEAVSFGRTLDKMTSAIEDPVKEVAGRALKGFGRTVGVGLDVVDRVAGTAAAGMLDSLINPTMDEETFSFASYSRERRSHNESEYPELDKYIPVSLASDIGYPLGESTFKHLAKAAKAIGLDDLAYVMEGFAPGAGMFSSLVVGGNQPIPKLGGLTKAGQQAARVGELESGIARQFSTGQRAVGIEFGGFAGVPKKTVNLPSQKVGDLIDIGNRAMTKMEVANLGLGAVNKARDSIFRTGRSFMSKSPSPAVNKIVEDYNQALNGIDYMGKEVMETIGLKAQSLGINLADEGIKKALYNYFDNPATGIKGLQAVLGKDGARKADFLFKYMDGRLQAEVLKTRAAGVPVVTKKFVDGADGLSSRYVPRETTLDKTQKMLAMKKIKDLEEVEKYMDSFIDRQYGGKKLGKFQKKRNLQTREGMNGYMKEKYGIDDFFHDDFALAYASKMTELRRARVEKQFVDKLLGVFGNTEEAYIQAIKQAKRSERIYRRRGQIPPADISYIASLEGRRLGALKELPPDVKNRLRQIGSLTDGKGGPSNIKLPAEIADYIADTLGRPKLHDVEVGLLAFQNSMKGFMFFNPGYHIRNAAESYGRAMSYGAGSLEHAMATTAMLKKQGPYTKYVEDFKAVNPNLGVASNIDDVGRKMIELNASGTKFPRSFLKQDNPMKIGMRAMKEIVARGNWKKFLKEFREGNVNLRENPLFKFSTEFGVQAENLSRFALYSKFREMGYVSREAMRQVDRIFPDYQILRAPVRKIGLYAPFANYFAKNFETTLKIFAEAPRGAAVMGPQGALQKAIENWAGFDPERTYRYKEKFGDWADDYILLNVMPSAEYADKQTDFIKQLMARVNSHLDPGEVIWGRLPGNYHALKQMDPRQMHTNFGPLARAGYAMFGHDPFTGRPLKTEETHKEWDGRFGKAFEELTNPIVPHAAMPLIQEGLNQLYDVWADRFGKAGLSDIDHKVLFNNKTEKGQKRLKKAMTKFTTFWTGGSTELDMQSYALVNARMKAEEELLTSELYKEDITDKEIDKLLSGYLKAVDDVIEILDVTAEFEDAIDRAGGTSPAPIYMNYIDMGPEEVIEDGL